MTLLPLRHENRDSLPLKGIAEKVHIQRYLVSINIDAHRITKSWCIENLEKERN